MKSIGLDENGVQIAFLEGRTIQPTDQDCTSLGNVYKDTCYVKDAEPNSVPCECEEFDEPEDEFSIPGARTVEFETSDMDPEACYKIWGGTLSANKDQWDEPDVLKSREVAVKFTSRTGLRTMIGRGKLTSWRDQKLSKSEYGRIKHRIKVMKPKIAGVKKYSVINTTIAPAEGVKITTADTVELLAAAKTVTRTVSVSNGDQGWTVAKSGIVADWLTVEKTGQKVSYTAAVNTGAARSSEVVITSGVQAITVTVNQAGV